MDRPLTAVVLTLGCKVNQYESAAILQRLTDSGFIPVSKDDPADVTIINTCTVTHKADFEVRALARRAHRQNPFGRIIMTGCLAQSRPQELLDLPGVQAVTGQDEKANLIDFCLDAARTGIFVESWGRGIRDLGYPTFDRTRAFFRIQDGCPSACSYCAVPASRGSGRSLGAEAVLEGLTIYHRSGYEEVVLTGIHLGAWGWDLQPRQSFSNLLGEILKDEGPRIRISSIEPVEVTAEIIRLARESERLCPHFHIPLQSGSDRILKAMRRPYTTARYRETIAQLAETAPHVCLGADVMVGFPERALRNLKSAWRSFRICPLIICMFFPIRNDLGLRPPCFQTRFPLRKRRGGVSVLRAIGLEKRKAFFLNNIGLIRPTLIENAPDRATGLPRGLTDNYIQVFFKEDRPKANTVVAVELSGIDEEGRVWGQVKPD